MRPEFLAKTRLTRQQLAIAAVVLVAVVVLAVVLLRRSAGQQALAQATENLLAAESFHATTELVINLPQRFRNADRPFTQVTVRIDGDVQQADDSTPELTGTLLMEARGRGNIFFADGQVRILRDEVLFNLDNLPVFLNPTGSLVKRWTRVEAGLLKTQNGEAVKETLALALATLAPAGTDVVEGESLARFSGTITPEQEEQLYETLRRRASGNAALHQVARLLQANNVKSFEVWVDTARDEVRKVAVHFVRPLAGDEEFDFATLTLTFSDYGKDVAIDRPETRLRVSPEVFGRLFAAGETGEIELQDEEQ